MCHYTQLRQLKYRPYMLFIALTRVLSGYPFGIQTWAVSVRSDRCAVKQSHNLAESGRTYNFLRWMSGEVSFLTNTEVEERQHSGTYRERGPCGVRQMPKTALHN